MRIYMQYTQQVSWVSVIMLWLSCFLSKPADATVYQAQPGKFIEIGTVNMTRPGNAVSTGSRCWNGYISQTIPNNAPISWAYPSTTTIDGYTGILIDGLLYVVYSGYFKTTPTKAITFQGGTVQFDQFGNARPLQSYVTKEKDNCWGTLDKTLGGPNSNFTVSVKTGIYVPKDYAYKTVSLANVYAGNANHSSKELLPINIFSKTDSFEVKPSPITCAVVSPTTIEFGNINASNILASNVLLKSNSHGLDIICLSCTNTDVATNVKISFAGGYSDDNWSHLNMVNKNNVPMAYIQGQYLDSPNNLCQDHVINEVGFDGTKHAKTLANVVAGITTHIPITWGLCSNGSRLLGTGSAQATVNIDWD